MPVNKSAKQKLNASAGTACELAGVDDLLPKVLWVPLFLAEQGHKVENDVMHKGNQSAIWPEKNGQKSAGERTHALDIRFFVTTNHTELGR